MTLVTTEGGLVVMHGGLVGTGQACCCTPPPVGACCTDGVCTETTEAECAGTWQGADTTCETTDCPCPSGCPSLEGCSWVVSLDYGGGIVIELLNEAMPPYTDAVQCAIGGIIAEDLDPETGGDLDASIYIEYDEDCNPVPGQIDIIFANPDAESFPQLVVTITCNPLP